MAAAPTTGIAVPEAGALRVRLLRLLSAPDYRPPRLPAVALDLLALSRKPSVEFAEAEALLERDPILAARVLSVCQSVAYARGRPVLSLRQAVVRLGLKGLRDVVLEAALHLRVFRAPGYDGLMERLARHSTAVARVMPALCGRAQVDTEYAFLCGLLHDVGFAACLLALSDDARAGAVPFEVAGPVIAGAHEEASGLLARMWDLPAEIQRVVGSHHSLAFAGATSPVKAALALAEALVWERGAGLSPAGVRDGLDGIDDRQVAAARAALRVDDATWAALRAEAAEVAAQL